eukprot:COSAG01_NODE_81_length_27820_cov_22.659753_24_plen_544_part_00
MSLIQILVRLRCGVKRQARAALSGVKRQARPSRRRKLDSAPLEGVFAAWRFTPQALLYRTLGIMPRRASWRARAEKADDARHAEALEARFCQMFWADVRDHTLRSTIVGTTVDAMRQMCVDCQTPAQVYVIARSDGTGDAAAAASHSTALKTAATMRAAGIRVEVSTSEGKLASRFQDAHLWPDHLAEFTAECGQPGTEDEGMVTWRNECSGEARRGTVAAAILALRPPVGFRFVTTDAATGVGNGALISAAGLQQSKLQPSHQHMFELLQPPDAFLPGPTLDAAELTLPQAMAFCKAHAAAVGFSFCSTAKPVQAPPHSGDSPATFFCFLKGKVGGPHFATSSQDDKRLRSRYRQVDQSRNGVVTQAELALALRKDSSLGRLLCLSAVQMASLRERDRSTSWTAEKERRLLWSIFHEINSGDLVDGGDLSGRTLSCEEFVQFAAKKRAARAQEVEAQTDKARTEAHQWYSYVKRPQGNGLYFLVEPGQRPKFHRNPRSAQSLAPWLTPAFLIPRDDVPQAAHCGVIWLSCAAQNEQATKIGN